MARFCPPPAWAKNSRKRGAFAKGRAYEKKVLRDVKKEFGEAALLNPWIEFVDAGGYGWARPDALVELREHVLVIEVKLSHCLDGVEQLTRLYAPLAQFLYPGKNIRCIEACKYIGGVATPLFGSWLGALASPDPVAVLHHLG